MIAPIQASVAPSGPAHFVVCAGHNTGSDAWRWVEKESAYQRHDWRSDGVAIVIRVLP